MRRAPILLLIVVACLAVVVWLTRDRSALRPDAPAVVAQVRQLNQLATVRYTIQKVVGVREPAYPVGEESILLVVQANVEAGVNLQSLRPDHVDVREDGTLLIRLPRAEILNAALDERETKVWDRQKTWWTPWVPYSKDLEQRARVQGLDAAKKAALEMGILRQAERNAETAIRGLLQLGGVKVVEIVPAGVS